MSEILTRIRKYEAKDIKITSIDSLIIARPLLKKWRTDSWQTEYRIIRNQTTSLQSAGRDRIFNTNDDIYSE